MFERFTVPAREAVVLAQRLAVHELGHDHVGTEHLLLALLAEQRGMAARLLAARGLTLEEVREQVAAGRKRQEAAATGQVPFTPGAKRALDLSVDEARRLEHAMIGTEHVLLGLLSGRDDGVARVLAQFGTDPEEVYRDVIAAFSGPAPD